MTTSANSKEAASDITMKKTRTTLVEKGGNEESNVPFPLGGGYMVYILFFRTLLTVCHKTDCCAGVAENVCIGFE